MAVDRVGRSEGLTVDPLISSFAEVRGMCEIRRQERRGHTFFLQEKLKRERYLLFWRGGRRGSLSSLTRD